MTAAGKPGEPAFEDLTARARIRDAAIRLFTEHGTGGTSIREIAAAAGVSGGLVRHHFGSKDDLRDVCDAYVLDQLMRFKEHALAGGQPSDLGFLPAAEPALLGMLRYFARSVVDGSPAADAMFTTMVGLAEQWLRDHNPGQMSDPAAFAALLVAMETGALVMRAQLSRALGTSDIFEPDGYLRLARARLDFYSKPLLDPGLAAQLATALDKLEDTP